jgi:chemotaxis methyl-accepting protein methylase
VTDAEDARGQEDGVERAATLLGELIGLRVAGAMRHRVERAVRDGAAARGQSPADYVRALAADRAAAQALVDATTVQETGFFRDPQHFDVLVQRALPTLPSGGVVWSAGCANGQEAWSLAIALEEAGAADWKVLATDVSSGALERTEAGRYTERELAGLSAARRRVFLRRGADGAWEVGPRLRRRVHVRAHNLAEEGPPGEAGACRVVFCRNVLIYLDADATERALRRLRERMPDDGWLFLGASESLTAGLGCFAPQRVGGAHVYRPRSRRRAASPSSAGSAAPRRPPPPPPPPPPAERPVADDDAPAPATSSARDRPEALPDPRALLADGEAHAAAGQLAEAAAAFRKASYLAPDDPRPLVGLGLALEPGDRRAALRAFRAARAAIARADPAAGGDGAADGWSGPALERLLDAKLDGSP